jgi:hypothetical protein
LLICYSLTHKIKLILIESNREEAQQQQEQEQDENAEGIASGDYENDPELAEYKLDEYDNEEEADGKSTV